MLQNLDLKAFSRPTISTKILILTDHKYINRILFIFYFIFYFVLVSMESFSSALMDLE